MSMHNHFHWTCCWGPRSYRYSSQHASEDSKYGSCCFSDSRGFVNSIKLLTCEREKPSRTQRWPTLQKSTARLCNSRAHKMSARICLSFIPNAMQLPALACACKLVERNNMFLHDWRRLYRNKCEQLHNAPTASMFAQRRNERFKGRSNRIMGWRHRFNL
jgi:hypothetical protein